MANIGGNIYGVIQTVSTAKNAIGESVKAWEDAFRHIGWLGMQSGEKRYTTYNAKVEESSHVFLCDFHSGIYGLADQDTRMIINGAVYDVIFVDNPDEMNEQLEIYLRKVGAWDGKG
jgi:head-tail adaptor